ncbi:MAG: class I SAM-dependent methyltransferase [Armatimonadota bacterium]|nr:class I SAM-dependent methyltransferase [Armatimonadota bacterium]MDR7450806.1 class I SAM-dependent methyltransferase [Armatimonadota bacterium]MDR7466162.1 class I SAM-dependent methyltransferase [Armatimonadota bacterium]MDR7493801.1 class I SAM-dependent methyltransferase [Armatimonadota bacterium]MDR7499038.1 class I SAM-dependent methyltransferase [Armatimonadota bacterium]
MAAFLRALGGAVTDAGYLLLAASPPLRAAYRRWAKGRYRALALRYAATISDDPTYFAPLAALLQALGPAPPAIIAEVGAGTGGATLLLARAYPDAFLAAIDVSPPMLARLPPGGSGRIRRVAGDAFALPLRSRIADLVLVHNAPFDPAELFRAAASSGAVAVILSSAALLPRWLRRWRPASPAGWQCVRELHAGRGIAWVFRREAVSPGRTASGW